MTSKAHGGGTQPSVFEPLAGRPPLAARMRPRALDEVAGQQHLLAPGKGLRVSIEAGYTGSILFWGPPGTGKTTLARLVAQAAAAEFAQLSAVQAGYHPNPYHNATHAADVTQVNYFIMTRGGIVQKLQLGKEELLPGDDEIDPPVCQAVPESGAQMVGDKDRDLHECFPQPRQLLLELIRCCRAST